jgi:2,4-dienoyl-CoA reductase-like NADH-dependent reductase (Old Yellow Enzyme family)
LKGQTINHKSGNYHMESKLFTPVTFGPLTLRNRTIRSAAFESMCPGNAPSDMLLDYHRSVAAGGIGMTTVAYSERAFF